jgi:anti-anti-sigma regulatory factor
MTSTSATSARRFGYRYGNPVSECGGAQMRAQCRQLATVVTISGAIDAANIDRVSQYAERHVLAEKSFVLDLSEVHAFPSLAVTLLSTVEQTCSVTDVEWCLVTSEPVRQVLPTLADGAAFTTADSVPEAMHYFLDGTLARRRLLPLLNKTA